MYKRVLLLVCIIAASTFLYGCPLPSSSSTTTVASTTFSSVTTALTTELDYETWKNSAEALDLNGDRRINETDFQMYQLLNNFDYWRNSEEALDLNNDAKINDVDYEIFRLRYNYIYWKNSGQAEDLNDDGVINLTDHDIYNNYDLWLKSEVAIDFNDDTAIDVDDYELYLEFAEFIGEYNIVNYTYEGPSNYDLVNGALFVDLGQYLAQISISVNDYGLLIVNIPVNIRQAFGDGYPVILEGTNNMTFTRISPFIVGIDTRVTVNDLEVNFTLYLSEIEGGYSASYEMSFYEDKPVISFDIIKVE